MYKEVFHDADGIFFHAPALKYFFLISDINECLNNPCLHEGTCENVVGGYTCMCVGGWEGPQCETGES